MSPLVLGEPKDLLQPREMVVGANRRSRKLLPAAWVHVRFPVRLQAQKPLLVAGFHELVHKAGCGLKSGGHPALAGRKTKSQRNMAFAGGVGPSSRPPASQLSSSVFSLSCLASPSRPGRWSSIPLVKYLMVS